MLRSSATVALATLILAAGCGQGGDDIAVPERSSDATPGQPSPRSGSAVTRSPSRSTKRMPMNDPPSTARSSKALKHSSLGSFRRPWRRFRKSRRLP